MLENKEERPSISTSFLEGPIEKGETGFLPAEPEPGQEVTTDFFTLESDVLTNENLNSIVLPKFLMAPTKVVAEQSLVLLTYKASHNPSVFSMVLKAAKNGIGKFLIHFKDSEDSDIISTWSLQGARIHATDFGYVTNQRTEPAVVAIEISYDHITIDDFEF